MMKGDQKWISILFKSDSYDSCRVPRTGHPILNQSVWKCVFNYAVLGTSECVYLAARVSCILYLAPCLWREWMNNFRLSVAESSLRIKSRARKVCSVNHHQREALVVVSNLSWRWSRRQKRPSSSCASSCGSGLAHNSLACAVGEFTSRSPRAALRMRRMEFQNFCWIFMRNWFLCISPPPSPFSPPSIMICLYAQRA